jgi:CelD/BcsL family acetyltransferase involved in cellulose biosynthesis
LQCNVIPISELGEPDFLAWQRLADGAVSANPFAEPMFVRPAVRACQTPGVAVLAVRDGSKWLAALPVRRARSYRGVPGRCLAGWRHMYCFLGTPLVAPENPEAYLRAMIGAGIEVGGTLVLDWVDADGPLAEPLSAALASTSRPVTYESFGRAALYRRAEGAYFERTLSASRRAEYRRRRRQLEREVGALELRDESGDPGAIERFLALEQSTWKGRAGTALTARGHGALLSEVGAAFGAAGRLRLFSLSNDERTVAMICDLVAGDTCYGFKLTYDERLRKYSPGVQLMFEYVRDFQSGSLARLDSCATHDSVWVNRLLEARRPLRSIAASAGGPLGVPGALKWRAAAAALALRRRRAGAASSPAER